VRLIGLTGGIASGKSTVARRFVEQGVPVVDADVLAREAVAKDSPGLAAIVEAFGTEMLDAKGELDRAKMGELIFNDAKRRASLNAIVHPHVAMAAQAAFQQARERGEPALVYDVPLLFENGLDAAVDCTLVVWVDAATQLERLLARNDLSQAQARARIASQMSLDNKKERADYVLDNSGTLDATLDQLAALWPALVGPE